MLADAFAFIIMLAAAYALVRFIAWIEPDIAEAVGEKRTAARKTGGREAASGSGPVTSEIAPHGEAQ